MFQKRFIGKFETVEKLVSCSDEQMETMQMKLKVLMRGSLSGRQHEVRQTGRITKIKVSRALVEAQ